MSETQLVSLHHDRSRRLNNNNQTEITNKWRLFMGHKPVFVLVVRFFIAELTYVLNVILIRNYWIPFLVLV